MKQRVATGAVALSFVLAMGTVGAIERQGELEQERQQAKREQSAAKWRIEEDSPLWNCVTMGNHRCGPIVP